VKWLRWLRRTLLVVVAIALLAFAGAWWAMRRSLPTIDGTVPAPALAHAATIERDARGIPVISAPTRADLAYATGYAHAQDRYFQMDLSRRLAAGELSELFGKVALKLDVRTRRFGFRTVARQVLAATPADERAVVEAYARGVNAGLAGLSARPWEYLLLRAQPRSWAPEDSVLVVHSMWWQLQYGNITAEIDRRRLERAAAAKSTPGAAHDLVAFLYAGHSAWDTPDYSAEPCTSCARPVSPWPALLEFKGPIGPPADDPKLPGSNNWAVAGVHTQSGAALVANDMHLDLGVPAVWYPARLRVTGAAALDITGVTLPGTPAIAAGSNGHIAWGFTNSYGDFSDVRWGKCSSPDHRVRMERIAVKGEADAVVEYHEVGAGVVLDGDDYADDAKSGDCLQVGWLAMNAAATNFALLGLERVGSIDEALTLAPAVGIPGQNMVVGDTRGRIAWTLLGRVPRGTGPDRLFAAVEFRDASDHPRIVDPPIGRLWTANQRVVDGELETVVGDDEVDVGAGGYDIGARARQIRDDLVQLAHPATPADMLRIQTDSRALFMAHWRDAVLELLDEDALRGGAPRAQFRKLVAGWKPEAAPDSVGYRLVRAFRSDVQDALWRSVSRGVMGGEPELKRPAQFETAVWRLLNERPANIAPPGGGDWRAFLLARVDGAIAELGKTCASLGKCSYGERRPVEIRHPLSRAVPLLSRLLDMPTRRLPGDNNMPRVQDGAFGASERFAVSPGHEADGYLELPGGPSGHPLSPFYRSGFEDWAEGRPTPFLPGPPIHKLTLEP
jgi:penicillin amidase